MTSGHEEVKTEVLCCPRCREPPVESAAAEAGRLGVWGEKFMYRQPLQRGDLEGCPVKVKTVEGAVWMLIFFRRLGDAVRLIYFQQTRREYQRSR